MAGAGAVGKGIEGGKGAVAMGAVGKGKEGRGAVGARGTAPESGNEGEQFVRPDWVIENA